MSGEFKIAFTKTSVCPILPTEDKVTEGQFNNDKDRVFSNFNTLEDSLNVINDTRLKHFFHQQQELNGIVNQLLLADSVSQGMPSVLNKGEEVTNITAIPCFNRKLRRKPTLEATQQTSDGHSIFTLKTSFDETVDLHDNILNKIVLCENITLRYNIEITINEATNELNYTLTLSSNHEASLGYLNLLSENNSVFYPDIKTEDLVKAIGIEDKTLEKEIKALKKSISSAADAGAGRERQTTTPTSVTADPDQSQHSRYALIRGFSSPVAHDAEKEEKKENTP